MSASREKRIRRELREAENNPDIVTKTKKKKNKKPMTQLRAKKIRSRIYSAIAIVLVAVFCLLIFVNCGYLQSHATAAKVGDHKITPAEFNYFYQDSYYSIYSTYSSYGIWSYMVDTSSPIEDQDYDDDQTWSEYLTQSALDNAMSAYALYDAAEQEGFQIDEDTQAAIDSVRESLETYAESGDYKDVDDYLEDYYGKGASLESYMNYYTVQQTASAYATYKEASFEYTDDELSTYYEDNHLDFDKVDYRLYTVSGTDDTAKETAETMLASLDGTEKSFADAAYEAADEDSKETYEDEDATLHSSTSYSSVSSSDYGDWLFSEARVEGESEMFTTDSGYSIVMFVSRDNNDYKTVNVRHILASVDASGDDGESTDEDWDNCLTAITEAQTAWEESDMTEDTFASLAEEYSDDTGSSSNGGLYEDVYKGEMVTEFNDWCFDENRQIGDTGLVQTDYGYHLMYFSGYGDEYWKSLADSAIRSDDYDSWYEEFTTDYTAKLKSFGQLFTEKTLNSYS